MGKAYPDNADEVWKVAVGIRPRDQVHLFVRLQEFRFETLRHAAYLVYEKEQGPESIHNSDTRMRTDTTQPKRLLPSTGA